MVEDVWKWWKWAKWWNLNAMDSHSSPSFFGGARGASEDCRVNQSPQQNTSCNTMQCHTIQCNTNTKQYHILQSQLESSIEYRFSTQASSIMHSSERSPMNRNAFTFNGLHLRMLHCAEQKYTTMHWKKYTTKCTEILKYIQQCPPILRGSAQRHNQERSFSRFGRNFHSRRAATDAVH